MIYYFTIVYIDGTPSRHEAPEDVTREMFEWACKQDTVAYACHGIFSMTEGWSVTNSYRKENT